MHPKIHIIYFKTSLILMKAVLLVLSALVLGLSATLQAQNSHLYCSPQGVTPHAALRQAREMRRLHQVGPNDTLFIHFADGVYRLGETLLIRPEDSGTPTSPTVFMADHAGKAVFSGGEELQMAVYSRQPDRITCRPLQESRSPLVVRQLWQGDHKVPHASLVPLDSMLTMVDFRKEEREIWVKTSDIAPLFNLFPDLPQTTILAREAHNLEMIVHQRWATALLRVKRVWVDGEVTKFTFCEPESRLEFEHPWPQPIINEDRGDGQLVSSSYNLLTGEAMHQPGTWYQDTQSGLVTYFPKSGEEVRICNYDGCGTVEMKGEPFIVPVLETLVEVSGSLERPVHDVLFQGISFQHAAWRRPSELGHVTLQGGMYLLDAYKLQIPGLPEKEYLENQAWIARPESAVSVRGGVRIDFNQCDFRHLGATGLDYVWADSACVVRGCHFEDIGGTALALGAFPDRGFETHVPFRPVNMRELCSDFVIADNVITNATNEDWGCVGIGAGYVANCIIEDNEVSEVNYSGICVGWGWTPLDSGMKNNHIRRNHVHHFAKMLYDAGGIYTLSYQPGSSIEDNVIDAIYPPKYATNLRGFYIYLDEATDGFTICNNWCPEEKFGDNRPGPDVHWIGNGPKAKKKIHKK